MKSKKIIEGLLAYFVHRCRECNNPATHSSPTEHDHRVNLCDDHAGPDAGEFTHAKIIRAALEKMHKKSKR